MTKDWLFPFVRLEAIVSVLSVISDFPINDVFTVIGGEEGLDLGFGIEGLATEDDVWEETLLAVFLQGAATELQMLGKFLIGEVSLTIQRRTVGLDERGQPVIGFLQGLHGGVYCLALMRQKLIHVHCLQIGLSGEYKMCRLAQGKVFRLCLGRFSFYTDLI